MKEERLYIVGYMASGKTTFGRALAEKIGWNFIDTDEEIERRNGESAATLIREKGEAWFREEESRVIRDTSLMRHTIVACGGGAPAYRDNMEFMTLHGMSLWLVASPERMAERIQIAGDTRPLAKGNTVEEITANILPLLRKRQPWYCKALWRFSGEHLENAREIEAAVAGFLEAFPMPVSSQQQSPTE